MKSALPPEWLAWVQAAPDSAEVVKLCLKYLAQWSPEQLEVLPKDLRPPLAIHTPENVSDYAYVLVRARLKDPQPSAELNAMATFFAAAATRLSQLITTRPEGFRVPFFMKDV